jgi:Calcineurin-like phosphoesterase
MKYQARPRSNTTHKISRPFGEPVSAVKPHPRFVPIPDKFQKPGNLNYSIENIIGKGKLTSIKKSGQIIFHTVGDTGGINGTEIQDAIAQQMEKQFQSAGKKDEAAFFYHLGDVVYYNGLYADYEVQFYEPYKDYPAKIFAIPGNHDGDTRVKKNDTPDNEPSLTGFFENFCNNKKPSESSPYRFTVDQPWPYWTLETPFVTIIGLYSNVDGCLDYWEDTLQPQYHWFVDQLKNAPKSKCLMLAIHHPPFSLDTTHGGYPDILDALDQASRESGRYPDIVFSGHVHDYQRFTRKIGNKTYPHVVAGAGGYAHNAKSMHKLQRDPDTEHSEIQVPFQTLRKDVVLNKFNTREPGFLRITIDKHQIRGEYFINTFDDTRPPVNAYDQFTWDWKNNKEIGQK